MQVAAVAIGRNEGDRLHRCLSSLISAGIDIVVYVDSGSTDESIDIALELGAVIVELDQSIPFTAARARNAGIEELKAHDIDFIQFIDGDCEIARDWVTVGTTALETEIELAVVCGRRRERFPEASLWNRLIDYEWDTPIGYAKSCGGDALIRVSALREVSGYRDDLIAGEEPEMCLRLRTRGWFIRRLDAEMTLHDAAMTNWTQWWQRSRRAGYAFAEGAALHGNVPERYNVAETKRALLWGLALPFIGTLGLLLLSPWIIITSALCVTAQISRLILLKKEPPIRSVFLTLGKIPEAHGVCGFWIGTLLGRKKELIEYK